MLRLSSFGLTKAGVTGIFDASRNQSILQQTIDDTFNSLKRSETKEIKRTETQIPAPLIIDNKIHLPASQINSSEIGEAKEFLCEYIDFLKQYPDLLAIAEGLAAREDVQNAIAEESQKHFERVQTKSLLESKQTQLQTQTQPQAQAQAQTELAQAILPSWSQELQASLKNLQSWFLERLHAIKNIISSWNNDMNSETNLPERNHTHQNVVFFAPEKASTQLVMIICSGLLYSAHYLRRYSNVRAR